MDDRRKMQSKQDMLTAPQPWWFVWLAGMIPYVATWIGLYQCRNAFGAMLIYHAGMAIAVWAAPRRPALGVMQSGMNRWLFALLPCYAAPGVLIYLLWSTAGVTGMDLGETLQAMGIGPEVFWGFAVYYTAINAALEEYFWRGLLFDTRMHPTAADLLFGGYHGVVMALFVTPIWVMFTVVLLTISAWVWRYMVVKTRGVLLPWLTHVVADAAIMLSVFLLMR